jgi:hypothetical protein
MQVKAHNPYSQSENPISWLGWETGFASKPNTNVNRSEITFHRAVDIAEFEKAFYRGQGAQIVVRRYE